MTRQQGGGLIIRLRNALREPRLAGVDVDSADFAELHRQVLLDKPVMRAVFAEFYDTIVRADERWFSAPGARIELGAGSSFFAERHPGVVSTDIKQGVRLHAVVDAQALPFRPGAIRALYGIHCFHHFPDPDRFFRELIAVTPAGGGAVLIEPYHGPVAAMLFTRLFDSERFDREQRGWALPQSGPMQGANQALSYIVFTRDRAEFERRYPELEIVEQRALTNYPRYLLSGGLNFRSLVPAAFAGLVRAGEWAASPLKRWLALHHLIVVRRRA